VLAQFNQSVVVTQRAASLGSVSFYRPYPECICTCLTCCTRSKIGLANSPANRVRSGASERAVARLAISATKCDRWSCAWLYVGPSRERAGCAGSSAISACSSTSIFFQRSSRYPVAPPFPPRWHLTGDGDCMRDARLRHCTVPTRCYFRVLDLSISPRRPFTASSRSVRRCCATGRARAWSTSPWTASPRAPAANSKSGSASPPPSALLFCCRAALAQAHDWDLGAELVGVFQASSRKCEVMVRWNR